MSDTLRERLMAAKNDVRFCGFHGHEKAIDEAITELDRLEAEVKKPRLPEGWSVLRHDDGSVTLKKDSDGGFSLRYSDHPETSSREDLALQFLSAFLTTPDVVPTEPVQAAGEHWLVFFEDAEVRPEIFDDETAARVRYEACLRNWNCHLFRQVSPAETSDQGQRSQTLDREYGQRR